MLFYADSLIIRFFFVSLQPKVASTGYASAIQVNLIALGLHRLCPREQIILVMEATVFNPLQIHLLQMFALDKSQSGLNELKDVLYRHYSARLPFNGSGLPRPVNGCFSMSLSKAVMRFMIFSLPVCFQ